MTTVLLDDSNLSAIGDALRAKTGSTDTYKPREMAAAITALESKDPNCNGLHIPDEALVITGSYGYRFANNGWNWFIEKYGDKLTTQDLVDQINGRMFYGCNELEKIPFDLNFNAQYFQKLDNMFSGCKNLKEIRTIRNAYPDGMESMFYQCNKLRYLPEFENLNMNRVYTYSYASMRSMFNQCYSLRSIPEDFLKQLYTPLASQSYYTVFSSFGWMYALDELRGVNPQTGPMISNMFESTWCTLGFRLKDIIFAVQDDGTPYSVKWKSQTISLTNGVGYCSSSESHITGYNSGITADKKVTDDATYQALKDDPDWWTTELAYSRYNHDSAVNTINSLPDTSAYLASAGGTNTIKFYGAAGSATDGGAINTLTEEEIAVATAKGWTVSLV